MAAVFAAELLTASLVASLVGALLGRLAAYRLAQEAFSGVQGIAGAHWVSLSLIHI